MVIPLPGYYLCSTLLCHCCIFVMVSHGCVLEDILLYTVIPIPKNSRTSLYNSDKYKGIGIAFWEMF